MLDNHHACVHQAMLATIQLRKCCNRQCLQRITNLNQRHATQQTMFDVRKTRINIMCAPAASSYGFFWGFKPWLPIRTLALHTPTSLQLYRNPYALNALLIFLPTLTDSLGRSDAWCATLLTYLLKPCLGAPPRIACGTAAGLQQPPPGGGAMVESRHVVSRERGKRNSIGLHSSQHWLAFHPRWALLLLEGRRPPILQHIQ